MSDPLPPEVSSALVSVEQPRFTPSDAKDKAVADLTAACYQKASQLQLSKEEVSALSADFSDDDFKPGAGGKENLIYIEHAALRSRLDSVLGMGQWCVIPVRRWVEDFTYEKDEWVNNHKTGNKIQVTGKNVYVDAILLIRGCFVASAIGDMTYYPDNHTQNYGDAVEGAETAALRRCCKRIGVGLQAWRKDWGKGWWARKKSPRKPSPNPTPPVKTPPGPVQTPKTGTINIDKTRMKALNLLEAAPGQENRKLVTDFFKHRHWIVDGQELEAWPAEHVPTSPEALNHLAAELQAWEMEAKSPQADRTEMLAKRVEAFHLE